MGFGEPRQDPRLRDVLLLALGAAGTALCITLMYLGMRGVMDVGGACADGGPYVSAQPCPDGVAVAMVLASFGLFLFGGIATWYGSRVGGIWTAAPLLAWSGLFLALGWNFIDYGIVNAARRGGRDLGLADPGRAVHRHGRRAAAARRDGAGIGPRRARRSRARWTAGRGDVPAGSGARRRPGSHGGRQRTRRDRRRARPPSARHEELQAIAQDIENAVADAMAQTPMDPDARAGDAAGAEFDEGTQALLDRLERLADLRDRGLLGEAEYETAKDAVVRELETRS